MTTKNIVPRADGEGELGTSSKKWEKVNVQEVSASHLSASSDIRVAGNSHFGSELADSHIFTGSFHQTGSGATSTFKDRIITTGSMAVHGLAGTSEVFRAEGTGDFIIDTDGAISFNSEGNDINFYGGAPRINSAGLDVEGQVSASSFIGNGSGLTGVTGDWDGQHTGDAGITGSLEVTQDITASAIQITAEGSPAIVDTNGNVKMQFDSDEIYFYADDPAEPALLVSTNIIDVSPNADLDFRVGGSSNQFFVDVSATSSYAPNMYRRAASVSNSQHKANYIASEDYVSWYSAYGIPSLSSPMLTNTLYLAHIRWEISSSDANAYKLFDNDYAGGPLTIAAGDTLPVSVTFTGSNQVYGTSDRGITYPQGYFIATFLGGGNGIENASQFDVTLHYSGGITHTIPDSDKEMIAANSYSQNNCWKLNLTTSQNYLNKIELDLTANPGAVCYFTEFEYFQSKPASQSGWDFSGFTKYEDQTLYRKLSWNNAALAEVGSIDENGIAAMTLFKGANTGHPGAPSGGAYMYAVSGDMWVKNASGVQTQISPHDENDEWQYFSKNTKTGKVVRIRMEKMIRKLEEITGETFIEEE